MATRCLRANYAAFSLPCGWATTFSIIRMPAFWLSVMIDLDGIAPRTWLLAQLEGDDAILGLGGDDA